MRESFLRGERGSRSVLVKPSLEKDSSIEVLAEVTSSGESNVKPETCRNRALAEEHDLVEVKTDNNNQSIIMSKANKIVSIHSCLISDS